MSGFPDPIVAGLARGWKVIDGAESAALPERLECDVVIVGTGAGGGVTAEVLARNGLSVILVEEGPLRSTRHFNMRESEAYPELYQESASRRTKDKAINVMQGRCVGGSTTVNWTSSFRTPPRTLAFWQARFGLADFTPEALAPWFEQAERRLSMGPTPFAPNRNNELLRIGAQALGIPVETISRNVHNCFNLGYCGMGCPTNAKQSMLVTTIPAALDLGARLLTRARAQRLLLEGGRPTGLEIAWMEASGLRPSERRTTVIARHYVLSGGAINTPALLLRSGAPDPDKRIGARTFLHPTAVSASQHDEEVDGFDGAPQTLYSDHFLDSVPIDGPLGYKLEVAPLHPLLFATTTPGFGREHAQGMSSFRHTHAMLALLRDGFHPESQGGRVELRDDGSPVLDYPLDALVFDGVRRALLTMAEIQFAAGAKAVLPVHERAGRYESWKAAREAIAALPMEPLLARVVSAHVMGGCALSTDAAAGVVRPDGRMHRLESVSVHDGSVFPTSIGANPQLSIYGVVTRMATELARSLTGRAPEGLGPAARAGAATAAAVA